MAAAKKRGGSGNGSRRSAKASVEDSAPTAGAGNGSSQAQEGALATAPATTLSQAIQQVRPMARQAFEESRDQSQQMVQDFEGAIRERPIRSLLTAVGIGFLIGLIWR